MASLTYCLHFPMAATRTRVYSLNTYPAHCF